MDIKKSMPHHQDDWEGYTLEDLRYRRAYVAACRELEREKLAHAAGALRTNPATGAFNAVRRVTEKVPMLNYTLLALGVGQKAWKIISKFRGKKKKK